LLDNLDPLRRFELVYPVLGEEINKLLLKAIPEAAEELFGLNVIEMPNSLKGSEYLNKHPEEKLQEVNIGRLSFYHGRKKKIVK